MKKLVYSDKYDFSLYGIEKLHPFDGKKFSKAWGLLNAEISNIDSLAAYPQAPVTDTDLLLAHTEDYLQSLNRSSEVAKVAEVKPFSLIPNGFLQESLITPVKYACAGTILATELALQQENCVMNVGGGFHHAFRDHGEGFCFFADAALSIIKAQQAEIIAKDDQILMIDLDAHRGNGFESYFVNDESIHMLDMYNFQVYPGLHPGDVKDFPHMVPLRSGINGSEYLQALSEELDAFSKDFSSPKLAFYNAGTDILAGDKLGRLDVSFEDVVKRDQMVLNTLKKNNIPTVIMTSGGYSKASYKLVAELGKLVVSLYRAKCISSDLT